MEKYIFKGTPAPWVYDKNRDTHDSIIYSENAIEKYGYIDNEDGGVVGSSEWTWIKDEDARLIVKSPDLFELLKISIGIIENYENAEYGEIEWFLKKSKEILKEITE